MRIHVSDMDEHHLAVAEAFSRKARLYDDFGKDHPNLTRMRHKVRQHVLRFLRPGDRILELNAGTGADAVYFAQLGFRVHATDLSWGMVHEIEHKVAYYGLEERVSVEQCAFESLDRLNAASFDYVFSNMGGVNCVEGLKELARNVDRILAPGGRMTWVVMPPICLWEIAQAIRGDFRTARRRLRRNGTLAHVEGVVFKTWYHPPRRLIDAFGKSFRRLRLDGLSVFTPPADHKTFAFRFPRLYAMLCALDDWLADCSPFNRWGDFYILTLEKLPLPAEGS